MNIEHNFIVIKNRIANYEQKYGRQKGSVHLLAVSKDQPLEKIIATYHAGQTCFGESYVQEALSKITALSDKPIEWHFIGPIQSNKTRKIAENFAWVHSLDSIKIAKRLNEQRPVHLPPLNICIEVNINNEETKSGVRIDDVLSLIEYCQTLSRLKLRGLMAIPARQEKFASQREAYRKLYSIWCRLRDSGIDLDTLSMGMSDDFEAAIAEGSTMVRIGRAIYG